MRKYEKIGKIGKHHVLRETKPVQAVNEDFTC
jgi:hypothetical protein